MFGNVLTGAAGFLLAAGGQIDWWLFVATILGMTLVVGSACALNNFLDRDIDIKMKRTKQRPSVTGEVPGWSIVVYAGLLGLSGLAILAAWTNWLVVGIGVIGWITYVWLYGAWTKRQTIHGTLVGSISGAMPIAGGYAAASGQLDIGLVIVFLIMFFWQFPEFYSIAIYRGREYAAAKIPVLPVAHSIELTIKWIVVYTVLYVVSTLSLTVFGFAGWTHFVVMAVFGVHWVVHGVQGLSTRHPDKWSRQMFRLAMINVLVLCAMLSIGAILP